MTREPLLTVGGIVAAVTALLACLVAFGLDLTDDQQAAVIGVAGVVAPILVAVLTRPKVTPVADPRLGNSTPIRAGG